MADIDDLQYLAGWCHASAGDVTVDRPRFDRACLALERAIAAHTPLPDRANPSELGRLAYERYAAAGGGRSLASGAVLPAWVDLSQAIRAAWMAAVDHLDLAVRRAAPRHDEAGR